MGQKVYRKIVVYQKSGDALNFDSAPEKICSKKFKNVFFIFPKVTTDALRRLKVTGAPSVPQWALLGMAVFRCKNQNFFKNFFLCLNVNYKCGYILEFQKVWFMGTQKNKGTLYCPNLEINCPNQMPYF